MDVKTEILTQIGKLDYNWYSNLKGIFPSEEGYNKSTKKVEGIIYDFYSNDNPETGEEETADKIINCSIEEYCWNNLTRELIHPDEPGDFYGNNKQVLGYTTSGQIETIISKYLIGFGDIQKQYEFVKKTVDIISNALHTLKTTDKDQEYESVLAYFEIRCKTQIASRFEYIKRGVINIQKATAFLNDEEFSTAVVDSNEELIRRCLKPLSGRWKTTKIMDGESFDQLIKTTLLFVENGGDVSAVQCPVIKTNKVDANFVQYTFYRVYELKIGGHKITQIKWAALIKAIFKTLFLEVDIETIRKKFSTMPDNYTTDLKNTIIHQ